jgi:alkaline phosphatase D
MRIAFASCTNIRHYPSPGQTVWREIGAQRPDWLLLLGDNIYMDYFPALGAPKYWPLERFAAEMHRRYAEQYAEHNLNALVRQMEGRIAVTWDDHDFAWNNANGGDVSFDQMKVSRALFHQFRGALKNAPQAYPPLPLIDDLLASPNALADIYEAFAVGPDRLIVTDGRAYRRSLNDPPNPSAPLLGAAQETWLLRELSQNARVHIVASGSTLGHFPGWLIDSGEAWSHWDSAYRRFLAMCDRKKVIYLGGDIHENRFAAHDTGKSRVFEAISSGAAMRKYWLFGARRNFGVIALDDELVTVNLYEKGKLSRRIIDIHAWTERRQAPDQTPANRYGSTRHGYHSDRPAPRLDLE